MSSLKSTNNFIYLSIFVLLLATIISVPCNGQVTFSRDWNAGKRNMEPIECRANVKSATAICHMLVNEIRQLAGCEARADDDNTNSASFTGKR